MDFFAPAHRARSLSRAIGFLLAVAVVPAFAADWRIDATLGVLQTDNLRRTEAGGESQSIATADARFFVQDYTRTLLVDADGGVTYRRYDEPGLKDDVLPSLRARLDWVLLEERLAIVLTENYGQRSRNSADGLVPPDREDQNVLSVGPDLRLPFGGGAFILGARYGIVDYETSPDDSRKKAGEIGYEMGLDSGHTLAFVGTSSRTSFASGQGFDLHSLQARFNAAGRRTTLQAALGAQSVHDGGGSNTGLLGQLTLTRQMSSQLFLTLDASTLYGDAADVFQRRQDLEPDVDVAVDTLPGQYAVKETILRAGIRRESPRTVLEVDLALYDDKFIGDAGSSNRSGTSLLVAGTYRFGPRASVSADFTISREAPELDETLKNTRLSASGVYALTRNFSLVLGVERYKRTGAVVAGRNFEESRAFLQLQWSRVQMDRGFAGIEPRSPRSRRLLRQP